MPEFIRTIHFSQYFSQISKISFFIIYGTPLLYCPSPLPLKCLYSPGYRNH